MSHAEDEAYDLGYRKYRGNAADRVEEYEINWAKKPTRIQDYVSDRVFNGMRPIHMERWRKIKESYDRMVSQSPGYIWVTKAGVCIDIRRMDLSHLRNCIRKVQNSREGWRSNWLGRLLRELDARAMG